MSESRKHTFFIRNERDSFAKVIGCYNCADTEPETCDYIWIDSDGSVYFDSESIDQMILFIAHHDAFNLSAIEPKKQPAAPYAQDTEAELVKARAAAGWVK